MAILDYIGGTPGNYTLGRGKLYLQGEISGHPLGWRDLGNCTSFTLTQESEKKEHLSFLTGIKTVDLEVAVSTKVTCSFTIDEVGNMLNLAPFLSGDAAGGLAAPSFASSFNAAACASNDIAGAGWGGVGPVTPGLENYWLPGGVTAGVWYDLNLDFAFGTGVWRAVNFDSTQTITVRQNEANRTTSATGALTEGTHYELDRKMGRIRFTAGTTQSIQVRWTAPAVNRHYGLATLQGQDVDLAIVKPLTNSGLTLALKFIGENPSNGLFTEYEFFKVKLSPDGDLALIGDDWGAMSFTGVLSTIASPPNALGCSPYGRVTSRASFVA
jgi:hypothetical protein